MALDRERVVSTRSPYVRVTVVIDGQSGNLEFEALIDTGFDGEVIVPSAMIGPNTQRRGHTT